ncbi:ExbD/TolR family protein [Thermodesulfobacterium hydrogeniphilum]|uniref:ExbD/TolR family protein n=1 Tax=Thermodesulfobacterium hydrogeniphilum TaxID=161156 RepID=UPI00056DB182|nr:biopolymer transporter ExbD [Thermodesulfobacterium hydrogeniphilum]
MKIGKDLQGEINIIPLVDIILVILIIFMITAPLLTSGIEVDLPKTKDFPITQKEKKPLKITITKKGKIKIYGEEISLEDLSFWAEEAKKKNLIKEVQIEADKDCPYGIVAEVLSELKKAGFDELDLLTQPES